MDIDGGLVQVLTNAPNPLASEGYAVTRQLRLLFIVFYREFQMIE
jgi:hypothetical protein